MRTEETALPSTSAIPEPVLHSFSGDRRGVLGTGHLLSEASSRIHTGPNLVGFGSPDPACPSCSTNTVETNYSLGNVNRGAWISQTMSFAGSDASGGYLTDCGIGLAVVANYS